MLREKEDQIRNRLHHDRRSLDTVEVSVLECFEYAYPGKPTELTITAEEFTTLCPMTGLPDFATMEIVYVPDQYCIELKSLKYYLVMYRQVGIFYEHVVNKILEDLVALCKPLQMEVRGEFRTRGGIHVVAKASYRQDGSE